ncbi:MAG: site-specific integrase [Lachnospiraceae bacterium]|nr:site-specific integrase [Lachnospiraceae bacterium]
MRLPNGFGNVSKLPGNRRRPYRARLTTGWRIDETGKKHQQYATIGYFETKEEGIIALSNYRQNPYDLKRREITFREVYERFSSEHFPKISEVNVQGYTTAYRVCHSLYDKPFCDIRRVHLQRIIDNCGKNYPSLKKLKVLFNQLYKYSMQNELCEKDYSRFLDIQQYKDRNPNAYHRQPFSQQEVDELWKHKNQDVYYTVILMLIYSGCRVSELLDLKKENVNLEERWFFVEKSKTNAGIRYVPISQKVLPFFQAWYKKNDCPYLISSSRGNHLHYRNFYDSYWKPMMEKLYFEHRPHDTRHTCITMLTLAGVNDKLIKKIVGHKGQNITETIYTHFDVGELVEAIDCI